MSGRSVVLALLGGAAVLGACGGGGSAGSSSGALGGAGADGGTLLADDAGSSAGDAAGGDGAEPADAASGQDAAEDAPPPEPGLRYVGRYDTSDPKGPVVQWPGARVVARFSGTQASVTLADTAYNAEQGEWDVFVDGARQPSPLVMTAGTSTYPLTSGLAMGTHTVELWRRTEELVSTTQVLGFDFGGGTLLPPPAPPAHRLEFVGDSASNGYGIDGTDPTCPFSAATENEHESYPALMATDLGADHHNLSYAGRGVYWNYVRSDADTAGVVYARTLPLVQGSAFDFTSWVPDVVWITLGGNDWDQPNPGDPPPAVADFQAAYEAFVALVRSKRPHAYVFCAVAPSINDDYPVGYNAYTNVTTALKSVVNARSASGDTKIFYFEFTRATSADLTGCEYHPNVQKHRAMATEAETFLKSKTGWP